MCEFGVLDVLITPQQNHTDSPLCYTNLQKHFYTPLLHKTTMEYCGVYACSAKAAQKPGYTHVEHFKLGTAVLHPKLLVFHKSPLILVR
jgi:hypothetical protein